MSGSRLGTRSTASLHADQVVQAGAEHGVAVAGGGLETGPVEEGLRDRFSALAEEHDGWYDPHP